MAGLLDRHSIWPPSPGTLNLSVTSVSISATGHRIAGVLYATEDTTVRGFTFWISSVSANGDLRLSIQGVANGIRNASPIATKTFTTAGAGYYDVDFDSDVVIPKGWYCVEIERLGGTSFNGQIAQAIGGVTIFPHSLNADSITRQVPCLGPHAYQRVAGNKVYVKNPWAEGIGTGGTASVNANNNEERGALVTLPFRARCVGIMHWGRLTTAQGTHLVVRLYGSDGSTVLREVPAYQGYQAASDQGSQATYFSTPIDLDAGDYYAVLRGNSATQGYSIGTRTVSGVGVEMLDAGYVGRLLSRQGSGAWTGLSSWSQFKLILQPAPEPPSGLSYPAGTGTAGTPVSLDPTVTGEVDTYSVITGALPDGLAIDEDTGVISGTPAETSTAIVAIQASNAGGSTVYVLQFAIGSAGSVPDSVTYTNPIEGVVGSWVNAVPVVVGGSSPTFTLFAGTLPAGLSIDGSTGAITGTPTEAVERREVVIKISGSLFSIYAVVVFSIAEDQTAGDAGPPLGPDLVFNPIGDPEVA